MTLLTKCGRKQSENSTIDEIYDSELMYLIFQPFSLEVVLQSKSTQIKGVFHHERRTQHHYLLLSRDVI